MVGKVVFVNCSHLSKNSYKNVILEISRIMLSKLLSLVQKQLQKCNIRYITYHTDPEHKLWRSEFAYDRQKSFLPVLLAVELFRMELCFPLQQQSVPVYYAMPISNPEKLWSTQCAEGGRFPSKVIITFTFRCGKTCLFSLAWDPYFPPLACNKF